MKHAQQLEFQAGQAVQHPTVIKDVNVHDCKSTNSLQTHLNADLYKRERAHRNILMAAIGALVLLGAAPVFAHHSAIGDEVLLRGVSEVGNSYLTSIHHILGPIHTGFHVLLFGGFVFALFDRVRAVRRVRRTLGSLTSIAPLPGDVAWIAALEAGLPPDALRVVYAMMPNPAFTVGWFHPQVYVANDLVQGLSHAQLVTLLAHEAAHVARHDPLRLSVLRFLARWLFWVPVLSRLAEDVADEIEVTADDRAAALDPLVLASTILCVAQWPAANVRALGVASFFHHDILERRVLRLAGENGPIGSRVTRRAWAVAASALLLVWLSGAIVAHPLPVIAAHRTVRAVTGRSLVLKDIEHFVEGTSIGGSQGHH